MRRSSVDPAATYVAIGGRTYAYGEDLLATGGGEAEGAVVYVGHGWRIPSRAIDPFAGVNVRDAVLLVLSGLPQGVTQPEVDALARGKDYWTPADNAHALGARAVIVVPSFDDLAGWARTRERQTSRGALVIDRLAEPVDLPTVTASPRLLAALMRNERESGARLSERATSREAGDSFPLADDKRVRVSVRVTVTREDTFNVVASVDGADPLRASEFIALGAHLDHIGRLRPDAAPGSQSRDERVASVAARDLIHNGADDDGSGVVALVEIAAAAMRGPRPARSLLFVWHTGEEAGGWGSKYLTAFPPVPLDRIVAQLNLDMVGRSRRPGEEGNTALTGPDELYVVGASRLSRQLGETVARVNREFLGLTLNLKHDDPADPERIYERSDHYQYARHGIPVAFFFSGLHADYHRPSDEVDRIDFVKLRRVVQTTYAGARTLTEAKARPVVDAAPSASTPSH
jgi:hypothetical protein